MSTQKQTLTALPTPTGDTTLARIAELLTALEAIKPLYEELDALVVEYVAAHGTGPTPAGIEVVDNFADRNTVFRVAGVKRFEAKRIKEKKK